MLSSDVADLLMNTDADTDTDTVSWVETVEWCFTMKKLSSPHRTMIFQESIGLDMPRANPA